MAPEASSLYFQTYADQLFNRYLTSIFVLQRTHHCFLLYAFLHGDILYDLQVTPTIAHNFEQIFVFFSNRRRFQLLLYHCLGFEPSNSAILNTPYHKFRANQEYNNVETQKKKNLEDCCPMEKYQRTILVYHQKTCIKRPILNFFNIPFQQVISLNKCC